MPLPFPDEAPLGVLSFSIAAHTTAATVTTGSLKSLALAVGIPVPLRARVGRPTSNPVLAAATGATGAGSGEDVRPAPPDGRMGAGEA